MNDTKFLDNLKSYDKDLLGFVLLDVWKWRISDPVTACTVKTWLTFFVDGS